MKIVVGLTYLNVYSLIYYITHLNHLNMNASNNITPLVEAAFIKIRELYNHEQSKVFVQHLIKAFGKNQGIPSDSKILPVPCCITFKRAIGPRTVEQVQDDILRRKLASFLTDTRTSRDSSVLSFTATYGWTENDTVWTMQQYKSLSSKKIMSRQAYIALQKFAVELEEQQNTAKENKELFKGSTVETVNIFEVATIAKDKKVTKK